MLTIDWGTVTCEVCGKPTSQPEKPISVCYLTESNEFGMTQECIDCTWKSKASQQIQPCGKDWSFQSLI